MCWDFQSNSSRYWEMEQWSLRFGILGQQNIWKSYQNIKTLHDLQNVLYGHIYPFNTLIETNIFCQAIDHIMFFSLLRGTKTILRCILQLHFDRDSIFNSIIFIVMPVANKFLSTCKWLKEKCYLFYHIATRVSTWPTVHHKGWVGVGVRKRLLTRINVYPSTDE